MKVLYDYQVFDVQLAGGISRYHADLYKGCISNGVEPLLGVKYSSNIYLKQLGLNFSKSFFAEESFLRSWNIKYKYRFLWFKALSGLGYKLKGSWEHNAEYCRKLLRLGRYSIFHPTYYGDLYDNVEIKAPIVITIHDMIHEGFPQLFNDISVIKRKKVLAERANAIIAISEFTKKEILKYYSDIDEARIHVVHHGIELDDLNEVPVTHNKENYILYVGDRWCHKDFFTLLKTIRILKKRNIYFKLLTVGRAFNDGELLYIDFLGLNESVQNLGRISDDKLKDLYTNAQMYVSTSMAEGFGLPLLECMKYGTPMVLSDIPVYREIAGDSAVYFEINDENSLADMIAQLYDNQKVQSELMVKGRERILRFDKRDMVKKTLDVYKTLL